MVVCMEGDCWILKSLDVCLTDMSEHFGARLGGYSKNETDQGSVFPEFSISGGKVLATGAWWCFPLH